VFSWQPPYLLVFLGNPEDDNENANEVLLLWEDGEKPGT